MCPSSGLWGGVLDCDSQFTILSLPSFDGPKLWRSTSVCSSLYLLTRAPRAQCSPSIPMWLASYLLAPARGKTQSPTCALRMPVSHDRRKAYLFSFLYIKLFELGVEVALNHRSAVTHHKVICSKFHSKETFVLGRKDTDHLLGWVISSCPIYLHADKRGMILALGAKGPGFDPQNPPSDSDGIGRKCNL